MPKAAKLRHLIVLSLGLASGCTSSSSAGTSPFGASPYAEPSATSKFTSAVSSGFKKSTAWLTPTAKEEAAPDPTSLAYKSQPPGPSLYVAMAEMQERGQNFPAAAEQYQKALDMDAKNQPALLGLARLYDRQDRFAEATELYQKAAQHHPRSASAHNDLGLCFARQRRYNEAVSALSRAVELEPNRALYRNNVATVLTELGRDQEALQHLVYAHGPANGNYNLGYLLQQRGKSQAAAQHFAAALRENPNLHEAQLWLAQLRPAQQPQQSPMATTRLPSYTGGEATIRTAGRTSGDAAPAPPLRSLPRYPEAAPAAAPSNYPSSQTPGSAAPYPSLQQPWPHSSNRFSTPASNPPSPQPLPSVLPVNYEEEVGE